MYRICYHCSKVFSCHKSLCILCQKECRNREKWEMEVKGKKKYGGICSNCHDEMIYEVIGE